ncbi:MAG: hypothetical protein D6785_00480, partial [Planctomycetota bacterium]
DKKNDLQQYPPVEEGLCQYGRKIVRENCLVCHIIKGNVKMTVFGYEGIKNLILGACQPGEGRIQSS